MLRRLIFKVYHVISGLVAARDLEGMRTVFAHMFKDLWACFTVGYRARDFKGFFSSFSLLLHDFVRTGPYLAKSEDTPLFFSVFGLPVQFERPSQITERYSAIHANIGDFGIFHTRQKEFFAFRQGYIEAPRSKDLETLARDFGIRFELADLISAAWMTDWQFILFQHESGPLLFGENRYIGEREDDDIALANWRVVEKEVFGNPGLDHDLVYASRCDLHYFGTWGAMAAQNGLDQVTPKTKVIDSDGDIWIRTELLDEYVSSLADYPLLCEHTHAEVCCEIEAAALESWVMDEIGRLLGEERDDLGETWDDLPFEAQQEIWSQAVQLAPSPYQVIDGEFRVEFDQIMPHILAQLPNSEAVSRLG